MKKITLLSLLFFTFCFVSVAQEPQLADYEPVYNQDFNTLPTGSETELTGSWTNNVTLPGWYIGSTGTTPTVLSYINVKSTWLADSAAVGSKTGFVNIGYNFESDRSIGYFIANAVGNGYFGVKIKNADDTKKIKSLKVKFVGKQWSSSHTVVQDLIFSYKVNAADLEIGSDEGWIAVDALKFSSPSLNTKKGTTKFINGNESQNRVELETTFDVAIPKGDIVWLRWYDVNDESTDHILTIDDLEVTAIFDDNTSVENVDFERNMQLYYNSKGSVSLKSKERIKSITLFNLSGQVVREVLSLDTNEATINTQKIVSGIYFLKVRSHENQLATVKVIL